MTKKSIKDISDDFINLILDNIYKLKDFILDLFPKTTGDFLDLLNLLFVFFLLSISVWYLKMEFKFHASQQVKEKPTRL